MYSERGWKGVHLTLKPIALHLFFTHARLKGTITTTIALGQGSSSDARVGERINFGVAVMMLEAVGKGRRVATKRDSHVVVCSGRGDGRGR